MSELKLTGRLLVIKDKQQVTDTFAKREFVIETEGEYPQPIKFELTQAKCEDIDKYQVGQTIDVHFNVRGRKWTNKQGKDVYFVSLNAWRLESAGGTEDDSFPQAQCEPPTEETFDAELPF